MHRICSGPYVSVPSCYNQAALCEKGYNLLHLKHISLSAEVFRIAVLHDVDPSCCSENMPHLHAACRLSEGFSAAASHGGGCSFMYRQPQELLVGQVQLLQAEYRQLLVETT